MSKSNTPLTDALKRGHPLPHKSSWADEILESHERLEKQLSSAAQDISFVGAIARELGLDEQSATRPEILARLRLLH